MPTIPDLLSRRLARDPSQPLVTFYDGGSGERTELSVTTYANWVAKVANLFVDELMLDPGDRVAISLPPHWLGPVFLGALWSAGLELGDEADVHVVGPEPEVRGDTTIACALRPFAVRYADPLPAGVLDFGVLWPGQSDFFAPVEPTSFDAPAPRDDRVLTDVAPLSAAGIELFLGLLHGQGSLVLLADTGEDQWPARYESERATVTYRSD